MATNSSRNIEVNVEALNTQILRKSITIRQTFDGLIEILSEATLEMAGWQRNVQVASASIQKAEESSNKTPSKGSSDETDLDQSVLGTNGHPSEDSTLFSDIKDFFEKVKSIAGKITSVLTAPFRAVKSVWEGVTGFLGKQWEKTGAPLVKSMKGVFDTFFGSAFNKAYEQIGSALITAISSTAEMKAAMANVQTGFQQMISPIAQAVAPALAALTNGFATVLSYAARLFSFLTGKSIKAANDTADAVSGVGSSAAKSATQTEEATRSLAA